MLTLGGFGVSAPGTASAADLGQRSLHISNAASGATTRHMFSFTYDSTNVAVGSVIFEYCTSPLPALPCVAPAGLDASGAVLAGQTGESDFVSVSFDTGRMVLGRTPASTPTANASQYIFDNVVNPTGVPDTFYARITTHASADGTGPAIDFGAVVNATTGGVGISTEVPPILNFCVGVSIPGDCSTAEGNLIDVGTLNPRLTAGGTSQMMVGTNADYGVSIAAYGTTMTSGNNIIPALVGPTVSAPGNAQFGLNLRANSNPAVGEEPSGVGVVDPTNRYATPNRFAFVNGDIVAASADVTNLRKLTVSYIVNVPPTQVPGVYTATLTYICTAGF